MIFLGKDVNLVLDIGLRFLDLQLRVVGFSELVVSQILDGDNLIGHVLFLRDGCNS